MDQKSIYNTEKEHQIEYEKGRNLRIKKIREKIREFPHKRILDVGCWTGDIIEVFKESSLHGVDISEWAVDKARKKGIDARVIDIEKEELPYDDNFFDVVICSEVLEHIIDQDKILKEIHRVLKPEGVFIATIPNINQPVSFFMQIFLDLPPKMSARYKSPHLRDFTLKTAKKMFELMGFKTLKIEGLYIFPSLSVFSQYIARIFPRFSEQILFILKKYRKPADIKPVIFDIREFLKIKNIQEV